MRRLICAIFAICISTSAHAQQAGYFEASVGAGFLPRIDTSTLTFSDASGDVFSGKGFLDYGTSLTAGAEFGVTGFDQGNIRVGVSYDYLSASLDSVGVTGTVNGAPASATVSAATLRAAGFNFDDTVNLVGANAYYNLPMIGDVIRPYAGVGLGAAIIEHADTQLAVSATLGARYALSDDTYVGAKYKFYYINGPTDKLGISYNAITAHTISALIGFYL